MRSEIIEARPYHCGQMARQLREGHKAVLIGAGLDVHRNLRTMFDTSSIRRAWLLDGRLMMIGGIEGPVMSGEGSVWIAVSEAAQKYPYRAAMILKDHLEIARLTKRVLSAVVLKADERSLQFARRMGFEEKEPIVIDGIEAVLMSCN